MWTGHRLPWSATPAEAMAAQAMVRFRLSNRLFEDCSDSSRLCVFDLTVKKKYRSKLAVEINDFHEHTVILCSAEQRRSLTMEVSGQLSV